MLTYYLSQSEQIVIRTEPIASTNLTLELEDMYLLTTQSISLSGSYTYTGSENLLGISVSLSGSEGTEYRASINDNGSPVWRGTIQVFSSESIDKTEYKTRRTDYSSSISQNEYIIL